MISDLKKQKQNRHIKKRNYEEGHIKIKARIGVT